MDAHPRLIGILAALPFEIQEVLREVEGDRRSELGGGWAVEGRLWGKDVVVVITGIGRRSGEVTSLLVREYKPELLLSCGFGGGTVGSLRRGEAVICHGILRPEPEGELFSNNHLSLLAARALALSGISFSWGRGLTVPRFISEPREKVALGEKYGVQVLEMENFWEAEVASSHQIPFVAIRFISDTSRDKSPHFEQFADPWGNWLAGRATRYFARHPLSLLALPGVFRGSWKARRNLKLFLKAYLKELDEVG
ncbi:MAG: hypothetical protein DRI26_03430 [Chloroflexi bacterium]|nr:MAG: hypothetical protein DRI26_03430 [Chloroflexota bacterium]